MSKKTFGNRLKSALYIVFSFLITIALILLSICILLESTILNADFIYDNMNTSNYFVDKKDEINRKLTDLGFASGLDESFFDGFVDEVMISKDTREYLDDYYEGKSSVINTDNFKKNFNIALDKYIKVNKIKKVDKSSREYLIKTASKIYRGETELPFFNTISFYVVNLKANMKWILGSLAGFILILSLVIFFTNVWKHRAVKYFYYSTASTFFVLLVPTLYLVISNKISKINVVSRALYNLLVECAMNAEIFMVIVTLLMFVVSAGFYILHRRMKNDHIH